MRCLRSHAIAHYTLNRKVLMPARDIYHAAVLALASQYVTCAPPPALSLTGRDGNSPDTTIRDMGCGRCGKRPRPSWLPGRALIVPRSARSTTSISTASTPSAWPIATVEADLWPPALSIGTIDTQGVASAWDAVRHGRAPIAVAPRQLSVRPDGSGQGIVHNWSITYVLTARADGTLYLVPAYRFDGSGRFDAYPNTAPPTDKVPASWYALVPAEST